MEKLSLTAAASMLGLALAMSPMTDLQAAELKILAGGSTTGVAERTRPAIRARLRPQAGHSLRFHPQPDQAGHLGRAVRPRAWCPSMSSRTPPPGPASPPARPSILPASATASIVRSGAPRPDVGTPDALKQDAAQRAIDRLRAGERGRRLHPEDVRPARHWRGDENQDQAADRAGPDRTRPSPRARPISGYFSSTC